MHGKRFSFICTLTLMLTLFAVPVIADSELTITLDANGGIFPALVLYPERTTRQETIKLNDQGENIYMINTGTGGKPEWEGKTLVGWSTDKNALEADYEWQTLEKRYKEYVEPEDRGQIPLDGSVTYLYAVWTDTYYITLDANGGDFGTSTDRYGNVTPIETLEGIFWYTWYNSGLCRYLIPDAVKRNSEEVQKGWSANKNALKPEYSTGFHGLVLNSSTPKTLYAIYGRKDDRSSDYEEASSGKDSSSSSSSNNSSSISPQSDTGSDSYVIGKFIFTIQNGAAQVTIPRNRDAVKLTIPATVKINGKSVAVTAISANAFKGMKKLTTVTIGKNIKTIGKNAFSGCKKLKKITIKTTKLTAKTVGAKAFKGINKKAVVKCPKSKKAAYKKFLLKKGMKKTVTVSGK